MSCWTSVAHILFNNTKSCLSSVIEPIVLGGGGDEEEMSVQEVDLFGDRVREGRLRYLDMRRSGYIERMVLNMELPGRRKRGRPRRRSVDVAKYTENW